MPKLSRSWWHGFFISATIAGAGILTSISLRDFRTEALPPENRPIQSGIPGYATSSACRTCHVENYTSWHGSFHRTMTQVATPTSLPDDMSKLDLTLTAASTRENAAATSSLFGCEQKTVATANRNKSFCSRVRIHCKFRGWRRDTGGLCNNFLSLTSSRKECGRR